MKTEDEELLSQSSICGIREISGFSFSGVDRRVFDECWYTPTVAADSFGRDAQTTVWSGTLQPLT
jgi:hypothetical protein